MEIKVRCNYCEFIGQEEDLKVINLNGEIISACPECLTDEYLMDLENPEHELALEYNGTEVYYLYKDNICKDSVWEYHYTLNPSDTEGFDIRELPTYNDKLSVQENLRLAIYNNAI